MPWYSNCGANGLGWKIVIPAVMLLVGAICEQLFPQICYRQPIRPGLWLDCPYRGLAPQRHWSEMGCQWHCSVDFAIVPGANGGLFGIPLVAEEKTGGWGLSGLSVSLHWF